MSFLPAKEIIYIAVCLKHQVHLVFCQRIWMSTTILAKYSIEFWWIKPEQDHVKKLVTFKGKFYVEHDFKFVAFQKRISKTYLPSVSYVSESLPCLALWMFFIWTESKREGNHPYNQREHFCFCKMRRRSLNLAQHTIQVSKLPKCISRLLNLMIMSFEIKITKTWVNPPTWHINCMMIWNQNIGFTCWSHLFLFF